jgi:hypothetical protein
MGFAAIARVTEDRWIACEARDEIHFGLHWAMNFTDLPALSPAVRTASDTDRKEFFGTGPNTIHRHRTWW